MTKKCINCNHDLQIIYKFCPVCGCKVKSRAYHITLNIFYFILFMGNMFFLLLLIISFLIK